MNNSVGNSARLLWAGLRALLVLTLVCGVIYPLAVTGVAQGLMPGRANGSEITANGKVVGSALIGQRYDLPLKKGQETAAPDLKWFQPRPSNGLGTNSVNTQYSLILSGATNRSGDNEELIDWVTAAKAAVVKDNSVPGHPVSPSQVPADAVTSSGSGLDPDISPAYARLQVNRVAARNHLDADRGGGGGGPPPAHRRPHPRLRRRTAGQRPPAQHRAARTRGRHGNALNAPRARVRHCRRTRALPAHRPYGHTGGRQGE